MSAGVPTCEVCGWQDAIRRGKPDDCPRCLRIKKLFLSGKTVRQIGKRLGIPIEHLLYIITRLGLRGPRPFATCPLCGWQDLIVNHKPSACARNLLVRSLSAAGMTAPAMARKLGITLSPVKSVDFREKLLKLVKFAGRDRLIWSAN